jgi:carboxypeptidase Q
MSMKKMLTGIVMIAALSLPALASPRGASTPKERVRFVRVARDLAMKPLAFEAVQQRQWATEFIVRVSDLHLEVCDGVISAPLQLANQNYNNQLSMQFMYSSAAFMIEHPKVKDPVKIQTAGVEGTLKAYESILKVDKNARFDFLDGLMQQQKEGQLENYVASVSHACGVLAEQSPRPKRHLLP